VAKRDAVLGTPSLLRKINCAHVLQTIRADGPLGRADVVRTTGLSKPTVYDVVEALIRDGYVRECPPSSKADGGSASKPGPRAKLLEFRGDSAFLLGVDIGADKVLAMLADFAGNILGSHKQRVSADARRSGDALIREVVAVCRAALANGNTDLSKLDALVIATPGIVDPQTGRVTFAGQLPDWEGIELGKRIAEFLDVPTFVENEVRLSALAESWRGVAQSADTIVLIQIGIGIGAGILLRGRLHCGAHGLAGEIGSLQCGGEELEENKTLGVFERVAGGHAFAQLARDAATRPEGATLVDLVGGDVEKLDARVVFQAARSSDPAAMGIVDTLTTRLARGIASVISVLDPDLLIIGGGLSQAGGALLDPLSAKVRALVPVAPPMELSTLGDESAALGAVRLALEIVERRHFVTDLSLVEPAGPERKESFVTAS